jgi:hypothetical protein
MKWADGAADYHPRYKAYAKHHGATPDEMLAGDNERFPGGCMTGYIIWIGERWREWDTLTGHTGPHTRADHTDFDKWLATYPTAAKLFDLHLAS